MRDCDLPSTEIISQEVSNCDGGDGHGHGVDMTACDCLSNRLQITAVFLKTITI